MLPSWNIRPEKLDAKIVDGGDNKRAVQEVVLLFAGSLSDQQTAVARCAMQKAMFMDACGFVLGTHRIIGAQLPEFQGLAHMLMDAATDLNQAAERSLRARGCQCRAKPRSRCQEGHKCAPGSN